MMDVSIDAPQQWVENIAMLRLPDQADRPLQQLMDRNNEGLLTEQKKGRFGGVGKAQRATLVGSRGSFASSRPKTVVRLEVADDS